MKRKILGVLLIIIAIMPLIIFQMKNFGFLKTIILYLAALIITAVLGAGFYLLFDEKEWFVCIYHHSGAACLVY